jgi:hypothetical protein
MRSGKFSFVVLGFVLIGLFCLLAGCSKDKEAAPIAQNPDDVQYQAVTVEVNLFMDSTIAHLGQALSLCQDHGIISIDSEIVAENSPFDPDSLVTNGGWHVIYKTSLVAGYNVTRIDSLQFRHDQIPTQDIQGADNLLVVRNWSVDNPDTSGNYRNFDVTTHITVTGINGQLASGFGTTNYNLVSRTLSDGVSTVKTYEMDMNISALAVPRANFGWVVGCPESGLISGQVNLTTAIGTNVPATTTWEYEITIEDGLATYDVTAGGYSKTGTYQVCEM